MPALAQVATTVAEKIMHRVQSQAEEAFIDAGTQYIEQQASRAITKLAHGYKTLQSSLSNSLSGSPRHDPEQNYPTPLSSQLGGNKRPHPVLKHPSELAQLTRIGVPSKRASPALTRATVSQ